MSKGHALVVKITEQYTFSLPSLLLLLFFFFTAQSKPVQLYVLLTVVVFSFSVMCSLTGLFKGILTGTVF